jgi:hypothetical protein
VEKRESLKKVKKQEGDKVVGGGDKRGRKGRREVVKETVKKSVKRERS